MPANTGRCEVDKWSVEMLVQSMNPETVPINKKRAIIPKFQRNLVWSKKQEFKFIDSLKKGYPIGSLLLFKQAATSGIEEYLIIDGLQRSTALRRYHEHPNEYFTEGDVPQEVSADILQYAGLDLTEENMDKIARLIAAWIRARHGFEELHGYSAFDLIQDLVVKDIGAQYQHGAPPSDSLRQRLAAYLADVRTKSDISKLDVPVTVYHGNEADLPEIFERINSGGSTLSKYQVFAATWSHVQFMIGDNDLALLIKARYDAAKNKGLFIEGYDPETFLASDFTLFEYLFGLGKLLSKRYPHLFGRYTEDRVDTADSVGFNLVTACCGLPLERMVELPDAFAQHGPDQLQKRIHKAIDFVDDCLKPFLGVRANRKTGTTILHSEMQIVAMVALVFRLQNDAESANQWPALAQQLKRHLPEWYLYDILSEAWKGTGDKKLFGIVSDAGNARYLKPIRRAQWDAVLNEWFQEQLTTNSVRRTVVSGEAILFLKYIYAHTVNVHDNHSVEYEIEHLIPVARLKTAAQQLGRGLPIGCVGNLILLDKDLNRSKQQLTVGEYLSKKVATGKLSAHEAETLLQRFEKYFFQDPSEVHIPKSPDGQDRLTHEFYIAFLESRFGILKQKFFELNNIKE